MRIPTSVCKPTTTTTSVCQRAAQGRVWSRRDGARWKPGGTVWWPPVSLEARTQVAFTCQHCQTPPHSLYQPVLAWPIYTNTLCFLSTICCAQTFLVSVELRVAFPCKHYEQNHCRLDNHLLSPVPLQPMSSSAMYYVPVSWSISGTCYCICVCILLQPITQGLCHYIFLSCFFIRSTILLIFVSTLLQPIYPSARHSTSVSWLISGPSNCSFVYILLQSLTQALCTMDLCLDLYPDQTS